jgi:prolipoprotein diacylglyceryltransferase
MKLAIIIVLGILSVIFQFIAAFFAFRIYKFNRMGKGWLALVLAFLVQGTIRIVFNVFEDLSIVKQNLLMDRGLMFITSLLILIGLWAMLKNFESFEFLEKKVKEKFKTKRKT